MFLTCSVSKISTASVMPVKDLQFRKEVNYNRTSSVGDLVIAHRCCTSYDIDRRLESNKK